MGLHYNGVDFAHTLTESHDSGPEKDPSGTDTIFTKTTIKVQAVLSPHDYPAVQGEDPAATAERITHLLTTPRKTFRYSVNGAERLVVTQIDDANGPEPEPTAFSIRSVTPGSFLVSFGITVRLRRCDAAVRRGYLSLKWTDGESIGADWTAVRRRTGLLICNRRIRAPEELRHVVTPAVPAGFRRESAEYELSEDGLRLKFLFIDRQLHKALPFPAVKVTGSQVETIPRGGGMRRGELSVRLSGPPGTDARRLFQVAVQIALGRVYASNPIPVETGGVKHVLIGMAARESLNDAETAVELGLDWQISPPNDRTDGAAAGVQSNLRTAGIIAGGVFGGVVGAGVAAIVTRPRGQLQNQQTPEGRPLAAVPDAAAWVGLPFPGANPDVGVAPPTRGVDKAATLRLYAAALMDPCGSTAALNAPPSGADNYLVGTSEDGGTATLRTGPALDPPGEATVYAFDASPGIWEHWRMTYTFVTDSGYGVVPSTVPGQPGAAVRFGNREKKLFVVWEMKRTGGFAPLPDMIVPRINGFTGDGVHDENWVGRSCTRTYENVDVAADGVSFVYSAAGEAEFQALDPYKVAEGWPCPPWLAPTKRPPALTMALVRDAAASRLTNAPTF